MTVSKKILGAMLGVGLFAFPLKAIAKPWHDGGRARIVPAHNFRKANGWGRHWRRGGGFHQEPFQRPASPGGWAFRPAPPAPGPGGWAYYRDHDGDDGGPRWYGPRHEGDRDDYGSEDDGGGQQNYGPGYYGPGYYGSPAPCGMVPSGNWQQRRAQLLAMRHADWARYNASRRRGNGAGQQYWRNQINYLNRRLAGLRTNMNMSPGGGYNCYGGGYYGGYSPASGNPLLDNAMLPLIQQFVP